MADLHKKLAMRRKGISGLKENESQQGHAAAATVSKTGPGGIMDSISSMIPPPPPKRAPSNHSDDDDNNDNDSDWD